MYQVLIVAVASAYEVASSPVVRVACFLACDAVLAVFGRWDHPRTSVAPIQDEHSMSSAVVNMPKPARWSDFLLLASSLSLVH